MDLMKNLLEEEIFLKKKTYSRNQMFLNFSSIKMKEDYLTDQVYPSPNGTPCTIYTKYNTAQSIHKLPAGANSIPGSSLSLQSHGIWVTRIRHFRGRSNSDRHSVLKYNTKYRIQNRMGEILTDCATQCATQKTEKSAINFKKLQ